MIKEIPVNEDHLEADLEQDDLFHEDSGEFRLTLPFLQWRMLVRSRGFRYVNMLSNKDTRVITVIFCRCPVSKISVEEANEKKALCAVH